MKLLSSALALAILGISVSASTPQDGPQSTLSSDDSTTLVTNPTVMTAESSTANNQSDYLELDSNKLPKPQWLTECVKLYMKLSIKYQYHNNKGRKVNGEYEFDSHKVISSGTCNSNQQTISLVWLNDETLEFVFTTNGPNSYVLSAIKMVFNPQKYQQTDSTSINVRMDNMNKFLTPTGSSYFCFTKETIEFATPPIIRPLSLVFKHLQFEAFSAKTSSPDQFSTDLAYCHNTERLAKHVLIAIVVVVCVLVMGFVGLAIYCICCLGKRLCDCCVPRQYGYRNI